MSNASFERPRTMRHPALLIHSCISFLAKCFVPISAGFSIPITVTMVSSRRATASCTHKTWVWRCLTRPTPLRQLPSTLSRPLAHVVSCESFRNFVMCLHGLDILSTWVLFFLPSVCDGFCVSVFSLSQGSRRFCHELYGHSTVMFCRSERDACFWKLFVFFVPTTFSGILGSLSKNSTVVSVSLFGLHANILGSMYC